ncbi:MAG: PA0069 family radical SAM protein [Pseudomonadota bacterium]
MTIMPSEITAHPETLKGRGARSNRSGRFETETRALVDDGWSILEAAEAPRTSVTVEQPRKIITRNQSPDVPFERSINPYRGCEHGCVYCFARPTHTYQGLSAGLDFETKLFAKKDAASLLKKTLANPRYQPSTLAIGTNTDPYQPIEREWRIMRELLEVLRDARHPVSIVTKSALVTRDIDILADMAKLNLVKVSLSVTTLSRILARKLEPRASTPAKRLEAIRMLSDAGIPTGVMAAPMIPALNDHEMEAILEAAKNSGAGMAGYILLRLPLEVSELFKEWLLRHYPNRYRHVLLLMRSMRGGKDYDAKWYERLRGKGPYADAVAKRFELAAKRLGLQRRGRALRTDLFARPKSGVEQLDLF